MLAAIKKKFQPPFWMARSTTSPSEFLIVLQPDEYRSGSIPEDSGRSVPVCIRTVPTLIKPVTKSLLRASIPSGRDRPAVGFLGCRALSQRLTSGDRICYRSNGQSRLWLQEQDGGGPKHEDRRYDAVIGGRRPQHCQDQRRDGTPFHDSGKHFGTSVLLANLFSLKGEGGRGRPQLGIEDPRS